MKYTLTDVEVGDLIVWNNGNGHCWKVIKWEKNYTEIIRIETSEIGGGDPKDVVACLNRGTHSLKRSKQHNFTTLYNKLSS